MLLTTVLGAALLAPATFRAPAVPLIVCDPYFSLWSTSDELAADWPRHWTGTINALHSLVRVDGQAYRLMGPGDQQSPAARQLSCEVLPTQTRYSFAAGPVAVELTFLTPALPADLDQLGRPVGYLTWSAKSTDGAAHATQLYFDHSGELVVDKPDQAIGWGKATVDGLVVQRMGSRDQKVLGRRGDNLRIDWGYCYSATAAPAGQGVFKHNDARGGFVANGKLPTTEDADQPRAASADWPVAATCWDLGQLGGTAAERTLVLAYDDLESIMYLGQRLKGYWRRGGWTAEDLLKAAFRDLPDVRRRCAQLDADLTADLTKAGGESYARLATLAFRQTIGGHKLVADADGQPLWFSKECFSNGCIATVDVTYPSAPFMLLFNPKLVRALLDPVMRYAALPRWKWPFAPHDLGQYPLANGQVYGGGERTEANQMPVEESGNLLILAAALAKVEGRADYAKAFWPTLTKWAEYLRDHGLDPANQLCTDDFSGHLAHNANLSIKAILGLGSYAQLAAALGEATKAAEYRQLAADFARQWAVKADDGDHYRLAFDKPGTWSQKYNLVWDKLLGLNLFSPEVARRELAFYLKNQQKYGLPLDNRKLFTKTDWCVWTATLAEREEDFRALVEPVYAFTQATAQRVPLTDWYWTDSARMQGFQARSVVGGIFIKLLADDAVWRRWHG